MSSKIQDSGTDLSTLLAPLIAGQTPIANVHIQSNGVDLSALYAPVAYGSPYGTTNIHRGGTDVGTLFSTIHTNTGIVHSYNNNTSSNIISATETVPTGATTVSISVWGSGGGGSSSNGGNSGANSVSSILSVTAGQTFFYTLSRQGPIGFDSGGITSTVTNGTGPTVSLNAGYGLSGSSGPQHAAASGGAINTVGTSLGGADGGNAPGGGGLGGTSGQAGNAPGGGGGLGAIGGGAGVEFSYSS